MSSSLGFPLAVILMIQLPLLFIWAFVLVDIVRQPHLPVTHKVAWAATCSVIWPAQLLYLLVRPQHSRSTGSRRRDDPHGRLVDAALDLEANRLDAAQFGAIREALRAAAGPKGHAATPS